MEGQEIEFGYLIKKLAFHIQQILKHKFYFLSFLEAGSPIESQEGLGKQPVQKYFERSFVDDSTIQTKNKEMLMRDFGMRKAKSTFDMDLDELGTIDKGLEEVEQQLKKLSEAEQLFNEAVSMLNKVDDKKAIRKAYALFQQAWKLNHSEAGGIVAMAHVFGIHFKQNLNYAQELFVNLSAVGEPRAQAGLALLYSLGINGFNRSLAKSLVYYTFGALGENPLAMMAMAYKNWQGKLLNDVAGQRMHL